METREQSARWLRWWVSSGLVVLAVGFWLAATACHGNVIRREFAPNYDADFDFRKPPCQPRPAPPPARDGQDDVVRLRYLGVSGIWLGWRGHALMTAPFFSDYAMLHAGFQSIRWRLDRIRRGMDGTPAEPAIDAILIGHSHYDHIGDVPPIVAGWAREAEVWVNESGHEMLAGCEELRDHRMRILNEQEGRWVRPNDARGQPAPFRILTLRSDHAPHLLGRKLAGGTLEESWTDCLEGHKVRHLVDGISYAFLIDLLDADDRTVFRIHYQESASAPPAGIPPVEALDARPVDLAITCMPSWYNVDDYPHGVLAATRARHVLVTHYEDFTGDEPKLHFVPLLTNDRANGFMRIVRDEMAEPTHALAPPLDPVCGPASDAWSMPLPGEWLRFRTAAAGGDPADGR